MSTSPITIELPIIPLEGSPDKPSCASCIAACCLRNTVIPLTAQEAEMMTSQGVNMRPLDKEESKGHKPGFRKKNYLLEEDCANLAQNESGQSVCSIYDSRPGACRDFKEGGYNCTSFRNARLPRGTSVNE